MADGKFKVAIATTDEINVDLHFGHADKFSIYEVDANTGEGQRTERRKITQTGCSGETCWGAEVFDNIAGQLSDVEYVLAEKIGPHAVNSLSRKQIIALDVAVPIGEALHKVRDYRDKKKLLSQRALKILEENDIEE